MVEQSQAASKDKDSAAEDTFYTEMKALTGSNGLVRGDSMKIFAHLLQRKALTRYQLDALETSLRVTKTGIPLQAKLAAVDVFSEKAIYHLTNRAYFTYSAGFAFSGVTAAVSWLFYDAINQAHVYDAINQAREKYLMTNQDLILAVLGKLAIGAVFLSGIYLSATLARAFFHEATVLFNRRHAIRFGRVHVYLKNGDMNHKDLMDAFGWNIEPKSAFMKIQPELVTKGLIGQIIEAVKAGAEIAANTAKAAKGATNDSSSEKKKETREA